QSVAAFSVEDVEAAVQKDAVVLESERALRARALERRYALRELGLAERPHETGDPFDLFLGGRWIPRPHEVGVRHARLAKIDELEQPMDRIPTLGGRQAGLVARRCFLAQANDSFCVVAVGAAVEEGEGRVGEPPY